jgi:hypothetical protein
VLSCLVVALVSLMDALAEVRNEKDRLRDVGLLQSATVLAARSSAGRSSSAHPMSLASPLVAPPAARGESGGLHCDHCGHDGHVEAFCYRKKKAQKAQAHRSSQGTGGSSRGSESSAGSETRVLLLLLSLPLWDHLLFLLQVLILSI